MTYDPYEFDRKLRDMPGVDAGGLSDGETLVFNEATGDFEGAESGGSLPPWIQDGEGSPVGAVTPAQKGAFYQDTLNGAVWAAIGDTDIDWLQLGGADPDYHVFDADGPGGIVTPPDDSMFIAGPAGHGVTIYSDRDGHARLELGNDGAAALRGTGQNFLTISAAGTISLQNGFGGVSLAADGSEASVSCEAGTISIGPVNINVSAAGAVPVVLSTNGRAFTFTTDAGPPSNDDGGDGDWNFSTDGHIYFKTSGAWVQKV